MDSFHYIPIFAILARFSAKVTPKTINEEHIMRKTLHREHNRSQALALTLMNYPSRMASPRALSWAPSPYHHTLPLVDIAQKYKLV